MGEALESNDSLQEVLDERIDRIVAAKDGGGWAAIEALLVAYDDIREPVSGGFVRVRFWRD